MTMRQYYKAAALTGLLFSASADNGRIDLIVDEAGKIADAMLAEDEKANP
jgi:hypothetical protein